MPHADAETTTDLTVPEPARDMRPLPPMSNAEINTAFNTARAFAAGGLFKDVKKAEQAFTKILAGRDLGLTPFEAMSALHVYDGKIEAGADLHATKVRQRTGYDFRVAWLKIEEPGEKATDRPKKVEAVWADEEDLEDIRDTYGCAIVFTVDGKSRGVSKFTHADAVTAKLQGKDNHSKYPRNMFFARAMTNGVTFYVPEVMGGMRVYGPGEITGAAVDDLTAGTGDNSEQGDVQLPEEVREVIARARELGHDGLSNERTASVAIGGQSAGVIAEWIQRAHAELDKMPPVVDAEPVDDDPPADEEPASAEHEPQDASADPVLTAEQQERVEALRDRAHDLLNSAEELRRDGNDRQADEAQQEAEQLMTEAGAGENPAQDAFEL